MTSSSQGGFPSWSQHSQVSWTHMSGLASKPRCPWWPGGGGPWSRTVGNKRSLRYWRGGWVGRRVSGARRVAVIRRRSSWRLGISSSCCYSTWRFRRLRIYGFGRFFSELKIKKLASFRSWSYWKGRSCSCWCSRRMECRRSRWGWDWTQAWGS